MKKLFTALFAIALSLVGCKGNNTSEQKTNTTLLLEMHEVVINITHSARTVSFETNDTTSRINIDNPKPFVCGASVERNHLILVPKEVGEVTITLRIGDASDSIEVNIVEPSIDLDVDVNQTLPIQVSETKTINYIITHFSGEVVMNRIDGDIYDGLNAYVNKRANNIVITPHRELTAHFYIGSEDGKYGVHLYIESYYAAMPHINLFKKFAVTDENNKMANPYNGEACLRTRFNSNDHEIILEECYRWNSNNPSQETLKQTFFDGERYYFGATYERISTFEQYSQITDSFAIVNFNTNEIVCRFNRFRNFYGRNGENYHISDNYITNTTSSPIYLSVGEIKPITLSFDNPDGVYFFSYAYPSEIDQEIYSLTLYGDENIMSVQGLKAGHGELRVHDVLSDVSTFIGVYVQ